MEWLNDHLWQAWLVVAVLLGAIELISLDLIFAMFAVGAVVAMITALLGLPLAAQALVAIGASVGCLALLRPSLIKRLHSGAELVTGAQALIGSPVRVLTVIAPNATGRVKIGGEEWTAAAYDEFDQFEVGEQAEVVEIRGATALIRRI